MFFKTKCQLKIQQLLLLEQQRKAKGIDIVDVFFSQASTIGIILVDYHRHQRLSEMTTRHIFLFLSLVATAAAWSTSTGPSAAITQLTSPDDSSTNRRSFLFKTTTIATSCLLYPTVASAAAAPLNQETALSKWKASAATIDNLLANWSSISAGGGDAIRKQLGTANFGTETSPLFQIEKAFKVLRDKDDVDLIEFTEQSEEFSNALARADTMAYSANFAGGSGKPTPPQVYIDKAKTEVEGLQEIAKSLSALLL
jgi:hypothetical protein